jgi:hypothetical protein
MRHPVVRSAFSGLLGLVVLYMVAALPALESDLPDGETLEAEHSAESCAALHDHAVCGHWSGDPLSVSTLSPELTPAPPVSAGVARGGDRVSSRAPSRPPRSRAPPAST